MPNYKETSVTGASYIRAKELCVRNELNGVKGVSVVEEQVFVLDGDKLTRPYTGFFAPFTPDNSATVFPLLDADGMPTGATATYMDVYGLLASLYYHLAQERDAQAALPAQPPFPLPE